VSGFRDGQRVALHDEVNWWCDVVLANEEVAEQVEKGLGRCPSDDEASGCCASPPTPSACIDDLEGLDWPASVLDMQRHWIGRS
jgi:leucyl-tRNA synthetase